MKLNKLIHMIEMCVFQVQQLYHEREAEMEERMRDVSRRARTPSVVAKVRIV